MQELLQLTALNKEELAVYLNISSKTLGRHMSQVKTLDVFTAEHALAIKSLYQLRQEIMESLDHFRQWMVKPSYGMGQMIPIDFMKTPGGLRLIKEELHRIEYGATA